MSNVIRKCVDCVHCDIEHSYCLKRHASTSPLTEHPRLCPDYYELFEAAKEGYFHEYE